MCMRDLVVWLTVGFVLGAGFFGGQRYAVNQDSEGRLRNAGRAPATGRTQQYLAEADFQPKTGKEGDAALAPKEPTVVPEVAKAELSPKAESQPLLHEDLPTTVNPAAQPRLLPTPVVVQPPPAKAVKKMVGPDGVVFQPARANRPALSESSPPSKEVR
jgi:hypothetical protein